MFGATALLTLATLLGLFSGLAREWLIIADWGVGSRSDTLLVAMFLPEAIRTMLASGLLSSAVLPLWQRIGPEKRWHWLAGQLRTWLLLGVILAGAIALGAPLLVMLIGPGLSPQESLSATQALRYFSLVIPCLLLQAWLAVPLQASKRFLLAGLGSLLFNLPAVLYLWIADTQADTVSLILAFVMGSAIMTLVLIPSVWRMGWRPMLASPAGESRQVWHQLWPLLTSSAAGQGLALLERVVASLMGEGTITLVNMARKLINLPLIALLSLNQVLLGKMSEDHEENRRGTLEKGLALCTLLTLPSAVAIISGAPSLVALLLPGNLEHGALPLLLACFATSVMFGSWNALLARYYYANGDTRSPLIYELTGSATQALLLLTLPFVIGINGFAVSIMGGVLLTGMLLTSRVGDGLNRRMLVQGVIALALFVTAGIFLFPLIQKGIVIQLGGMVLASTLVFVFTLAGLRRQNRQK